MKKTAAMLLVLLILNVFVHCAGNRLDVQNDTFISPFSATAEEEAPLRLGNQDNWKDNRVHELQERLTALGYFTDKINGYFGYSTRDALRQFQADEGIEVTGRLDEATRYCLFPDYRAMVDATNKTMETLEGYEGRLENAQSALACYGFYELSPSGIFDSETMEAIKRFQTYAVKHFGPGFDEPLAHLAPVLSQEDGTAAEAAVSDTVSSVSEGAGYDIDGALTQDLYYYLISGNFPVYQETLQAQAAGDEVLRLQRRLISLGYYYDEITGVFDDPTLIAVKAFQGHSGLEQTGVADEATQKLLYSKATDPLEAVEMPFYIKVSIEDQRVYIYRWMDGDYNYLFKTMICSTGAEKSPTPKGIFVSEGQVDKQWHCFYAFNCWAQYPFGIVGNVWFHSILFSEKDESTVRQLSVDQLGTAASRGCVRLLVPDAKWIYEHCTKGQVVEVY